MADDELARVTDTGNEAPAAGGLEPEVAPAASPEPMPDSGPSQAAAPEDEPAAGPETTLAEDPAPDTDQPSPDITEPIDPPGTTAPLPDAEAEPATAPPTRQDPQVTATMPLPEPIEAPAASPGESPQPAPEATVPPAPRPPLRERLASPLTALAGHRALVVAALLALAAAIAGVTLFLYRTSQMPPDDLVRTDAQAKLAAPSYTAGPYASDDPLVLDTVEIERKQPSKTRRGACEVNVVATFSSTAMETRADATLTYVHEDGAWSCTAATTGNASHRATAGVSTEKVVGQVDTLLQAADAETGDKGASLVNLYRNAEVSVVSEEFDEEAQADVVTLHCSSAATFVSYECDLVARFRFAAASGAWELAGAEVSDTARELGFRPLVGTWRGTFQNQVSRSGKCLAARDAGLVVEVRRAAMGEDGGATIEGTVTGVAHLHADAEADAASSEGDVTLDAVPFVGATPTNASTEDLLALLAGTGDKKKRAGIVFECTTQDNPDGEVRLVLEFGSSKAPDEATATLTSTHDYQDVFLGLVPYERESRYDDAFSLEKEAS